MTCQFIISGFARISSSLPENLHIQTLIPENETSYPATIYTERSRFEGAVDAGLAFSETAVSLINQTVANTTETALSLTDHLPSLSQAIDVLTTSAPPGGGPGDVPPSYAGNATIGNLANKTLTNCIPSIPQRDINANILHEASHVLLGCVVIGASFFIGRAIYQGYKIYHQHNQSIQAAQLKEKKIQTLIERQKLIEAELTRKRFKSRAQTLSHVLKFNKILTKEQV